VLTETFICVAKKSDNWMIQCVSHTQNTLSRRVWGNAPTRKIFQIGLPRLNFVVILSDKVYDVTFLIIPLQFVNIAKRHSQYIAM